MSVVAGDRLSFFDRLCVKETKQLTTDNRQLTTVKESSDELNPPVETAATDVAPKEKRSALDILALAVATCGVGYFPIAPGTLGSMVGIAVYLPIYAWSYQLLEANALKRRLSLIEIYAPQLALMLIIILLVTVAGIWAASRAEKLVRKKDPSIVVIDEVAGQMIALLSVPAFFPGWWPVLTAFLLFRLFDIWKPYPIRRLEALESGLGIMADDVLAGVYALIVNSVLISGFLLVVTR